MVMWRGFGSRWGGWIDDEYCHTRVLIAEDLGAAPTPLALTQVES